DVSLRYPSVEALALDLERAVGREGLWASQPDTAPAPRIVGAPAPPASAQRPDGSTPEPGILPPLKSSGVLPRATPDPRDRRRTWILAAGAGAALVGTIGVVAALALTGTSSPAEPATTSPTVPTPPTGPHASAMQEPARPPTPTGTGEPSVGPPTDQASTEVASRRARAVRCAADGRHDCVIAELADVAESEADLALVIEALRARGDDERAAQFVRRYLDLHASGPNASRYAAWLASRSADSPSTTPAQPEHRGDRPRGSGRTPRDRGGSTALQPAATGGDLPPARPEPGSAPPRSEDPPRQQDSPRRERDEASRMTAPTPTTMRAGELDPSQF
ncbi:MAG: hypothetical protein RMK74_16410, partial [Myxococcales bacterium]|nr:hypothetical protein [Myxococcales bacterium]